MRVSSTSDDQWKPLEAALREKFLPALSGRQAFSDTERDYYHSQPSLVESE